MNVISAFKEPEESILKVIHASRQAADVLLIRTALRARFSEPDNAANGGLGFICVHPQDDLR